MKNKYLLLIILTLTVAYCITLALNIPVFQQLRFWFWQFGYKPVNDWWIILIIAFVSYVSVAIVLKHHHNRKFNVLLLIVSGFFLQLGFSFLEGKGFDSLRDRLIVDGHSEFAVTATRIDDIETIACNYEELADSNKLGQFPKSKPPGALIVYTLAGKAAGLFSESADPQERYHSMIEFAVFFFPLLSYLVLIPLYGIGKELLPGKYANLPGLLYIFIPAVNLVTMNLDQVLYPLLMAVCTWLALLAVKKNNCLFSLACGAMLYVSLYITFSLTFLIPFLLLMIAVFHIFLSSGRERLFSLSVHYLAFIGGFAVLALAMKLGTDYDMVLRFEKAIQFHADWKVWEPTAKWVTFYAGLNIVEICVWSGFAFTVVFFMGLFRSSANLLRKNIDLISVITVVFSAIVLLQAFLGYTKGETARLWLFLVPVACLTVANEINLRFKFRPDFSVKFILLLELVTTFMIKVFQDF